MAGNFQEHQFRIAMAELEAIHFKGNPLDYPKLLSVIRKYPYEALVRHVFQMIFKLFEHRNQLGSGRAKRFALVELVKQMSFILPRLQDVPTEEFAHQLILCFDQQTNPETWLYSLKMIEVTLPLTGECLVLYHHITQCFFRSDAEAKAAYSLCKVLIKQTKEFPNFLATWAFSHLRELLPPRQRQVLLLFGFVDHPFVLVSQLKSMCLIWLNECFRNGPAPIQVNETAAEVKGPANAPQGLHSVKAPIQCVLLQLIYNSLTLTDQDQAIVIEATQSSSPIVIYMALRVISRFPDLWPSVKACRWIDHPSGQVRRQAQSLACILIEKDLASSKDIVGHVLRHSITEESLRLLLILLRQKLLPSREILNWMRGILPNIMIKGYAFSITLDDAMGFLKELCKISPSDVYMTFNLLTECIRAPEIPLEAWAALAHGISHALRCLRLIKDLPVDRPPHDLDITQVYLLLTLPECPQPSPYSLITRAESQEIWNEAKAKVIVGLLSHNSTMLTLQVALTTSPNGLCAFVDPWSAYKLCCRLLIEHQTAESKELASRTLCYMAEKMFSEVKELWINHLSQLAAAQQSLAQAATVVAYAQVNNRDVKALEEPLLELSQTALEKIYAATAMVESLSFEFQRFFGAVEADLVEALCAYVPAVKALNNGLVQEADYLVDKLRCLGALYAFLVTCFQDMDKRSRRVLFQRREFCRDLAQWMSNVKVPILQNRSQPQYAADCFRQARTFVGVTQKTICTLPPYYLQSQCSWNIELFAVPSVSVATPLRVPKNCDPVFHIYGQIQVDQRVESPPAFDEGELVVLVSWRPLIISVQKSLVKRKLVVQFSLLDHEDAGIQEAAKSLYLLYHAVYPVKIIEQSFNCSVALPYGVISKKPNFPFDESKSLFVTTFPRMKMPGTNRGWWESSSMQEFGVQFTVA